MMIDITKDIPHEEFREWWYATFNETIHPKDEFYNMLYFNYCVYAAHVKLMSAIVTQEREKDHRQTVYNFADSQSVEAYGRLRDKAQKKQFLRYGALSFVAVVVLGVALIVGGRTKTERVLSALYDNATKEYIDGIPYLKLKPIGPADTYELGKHMIYYNDSTFVIPLTREKMQFRK